MRLIKTLLTTLLITNLNSFTIDNRNFSSTAGGLDDPINSFISISGFTKVGDSYISIRGSDSRESVAVIDYLPIGYLYHFYGNYSVLNPDIIDSTTLYKSNFSPKYGNSMGSLIELNSKNGDTEISTKLNGYDASIVLSGEIENVSYLLSGRESYLHRVFTDNIQIRDQVEYREFPSFYDLSLFLRVRLGNSSTLSFETINAGDKMRLFSSEYIETDPKATGVIDEDRSFNTFGIRWKYVGDRGETETLVYRNRESDKQTLFDNYIDIETLQDGIFHISKFNKVNRETSFGFEYINWIVPIEFNSRFPKFPDDYSYLYSDKEIFDIKKELDISQVAIFLEDSFQINRNLNILYGFRFIKDSYGAKAQNINPRLRVKYIPNRYSGKIEFAVGKYSQMVNGIKLIENFGNPNLFYEQAIHYLIHYSKDFSGDTGLSVEAFHKKLYDLAVRDETYNFLSTGSGYIEGIDFDIYKKFRNLYIKGSYSFIKSRREIDNGVKSSRFYGEIPHSIKLLMQLNFNRSFLSLFSIYQSGKPYTEISKDGEELIYSEPFSSRLPNYFQLNFKFGYKGENWSSSFEILNLTAHQNVENIIYSSDYSKKRFIYGKSIMPWFSFKYSF